MMYVTYTKDGVECEAKVPYEIFNDATTEFIAAVNSILELKADKVLNIMFDEEDEEDEDD